MHSGLLTLLWLMGVALLQFLSPHGLLVANGVLGLAAVCFSPHGCWRLVRRIRLLLLAIVVLFAGFTPGEAILADWPRLSPSREGVALALEHAGRVLAVVFCVAILMQHLPAPRLVGALYALLRPFESIGFPADRVAVRTLLVLNYVNSRGSRNWQAWLKDEADTHCDPITVPRESLGWVDFGVVGVLGLVMALVARTW